MHAVTIVTRVFDGVEAEARLRVLGTDAESLLAVILKGEYARAEATDHDPIAAGPLDAYRYRVRGFRDHHVPLGWMVDREGGVEKTWSPCGKHVVITRAGDEGVGQRGTFPQPKRPTGSGTRGIVDGGLLLDPSWLNATSGRTPDFSTWMFLVAREGDIVRAELSWPTGITEQGDVLGWYERILLPEIDLADPDRLQAIPSDVADVIDVPVVRKR